MITANSDSLEGMWNSLPEKLRAKLLLGYTGKQHLLDIAGWCLRSGNPALTPLVVDALLTAFGENPLDGEMTGELIRHETIRAILPADGLTALTAVATAWTKPDNTSYFERLLAQRDFSKLKTYLEQTISREPGNLFWRQQALTFGLIDNDPNWVESCLNMKNPGDLQPVLDNVDARLHVIRGNYSEAARLYQSLSKTFGTAYTCQHAGLSMLADGERAAANLLLTNGLAHAPWNTGLLLRIHDLFMDIDKDARPLSGNVAVLLYTWNKDIEVDATLRSLFESDLTGASIFVLDNGSTDTTSSVLESWQTRFDNLFGAGRFEILTLPVNIGAPAARNWLMHHPPVTDHDFICYLDDDVILPPDWLLKLGAAVHHYPDGGVWGCKVVDHTNGALIQSADSHLLVDTGPSTTDLTSPAPNPFKLSDLHIQTLESGLFDILRPCASATGCCHLFRTKKLIKSGDFAIHLSPTQYDDMEHDLRLCKSGDFPIYQGHLAIRHKKRTGTASHTSMQEEGNALGNKYKMQTMHTHEELVDAMRAEHALLDADLLRKIRVIDGA